MKSIVKCGWCGKDFVRDSSALKGKKHHFCCSQCLVDFSNKTKNPNGYALLKDFTKISAAFTKLNIAINKTRMTEEVRKKLRNAHVNSGEGKTYAKLYGRHEHRVVAERILGRSLIPGEVVHHVDGNKRNNDTANIRIFESQSAHAKFHAAFNWFIKELEKTDSEGGDAK